MLFILFFVLLILLVFIFYTLKKYMKIKKYTRNFKKIKGICINDNLFYYQGFGVHGDDHGMRSRPYVAYTVDNRQYEILSEISYGGINAFLMKGRKFTVFYNPNNPYDAVLKNELNFYFMLSAFWFFIIVSLFFLFINLLYDTTHQDYQYKVICTINGYEFTEQVVSNSDKDALNKFAKKTGINEQACENIQLEMSE